MSHQTAADGRTVLAFPSLRTTAPGRAVRGSTSYLLHHVVMQQCRLSHEGDSRVRNETSAGARPVTSLVV